MEDSLIVELYHQRNEKAIEESNRKYHNYCQEIAYRILQNREDAEECVLDTWMRAWNHIPPDRPKSLTAYFGSIVRRLSLNYLSKKNAKIRGGKEVDLVFQELENILAESKTPDDTMEDNELSQLINRFLATISESDRNILICRYYFVYPVKEIAKFYHTAPNTVTKTLSRTLDKLKKFLEKENYL